MSHLEHFPVSITREVDGFLVHQQFGSTSHDAVSIKISFDQAKQISSFLSKNVGKEVLDEPELSEGFDDFWKNYPRKDSKHRALQLWKSNRLHKIRERIMAHLNRVKQSDQWTRDGGRFVPHAATYLSQARYLDEVDEDLSDFL